MGQVPPADESLKTIRQFLIGFKGYDSPEDMEVSDKALRIESAKTLEDVRMKMEGEKTLMNENYLMSLLIKVSKWAKKMIENEGKLRHALAGYMNVNLPASVPPDRMAMLLECDAVIIGEARQMQEDMNELHYRVQMVQEAEIIESLRNYDVKADRVGHFVEQRHRILHGGELLGDWTPPVDERTVKKAAFSGATICPKCAHYSATTVGNCPRCGTSLEERAYKTTESAPWSPGMGR
jgi:hypothetical protein